MGTLNQQAMSLAALLFTRGSLSCEFTFTAQQRDSLDFLRQAKAVLPGPTNARDALCSFCGLHRGAIFRNDDGLMVQCPDCGPFKLDPASQRTWRLDDEWLIRKLRGAMDIARPNSTTLIADGVWDIGRFKKRPVVLGRRIDLIERHGLRIFNGPEARKQCWVITPKPLGKSTVDPLLGIATWWQLQDQFAWHGAGLRLLDPFSNERSQSQMSTSTVAVHGPFSEDFACVHLDDWPHGLIMLTPSQAKLFEALWKHRQHAQSAEVIMMAAGLDSDRPVDLFKIKATNRGDPVYEGPLQAYEKLVVRQRRLGLYQLKAVKSGVDAN
jgi:hypothetical protein